MIKQFIFKLGAFIGIQALLLGSASAVYLYNRELIATETFYAATLDKHELLEKQTTPRLIFVGGSNVAFGIDSQKIVGDSGYNPVNMGLHAGLGLEYYFREIEEKIKPGDVLLVSLEYEHFVSQTPTLAERLFSTIESRPQNIRFVPLYFLPSMLDKAFMQFGGMLRNTQKSLSGSVEQDKIYRRSSFNTVGDMIEHHSHESVDLSRKDKANVDNVTPQTVMNAVQLLNQFNKKAEIKGAKVFYSYSPLLRRVFDNYTSEITLIRTIMKSDAKVTVIDSPKDLALADKYFFDSEYHLNHLGKEIRAKHIYQKLRGQLPEV